VARAQAVPGGGAASPGDTIYEVKLTSGERYVGRIVAAESDSLTLRTDAGTRIRFARAQAVYVRPARGREVNGHFWREDPDRTRIFFSPSGRTLAHGEGFAGVHELIAPFVGYGVTDRLTVSGGSPFYLAFAGETPPIYFSPKLAVVADPGVAVSVGAEAVYLPDDSDDDLYGVVYGAATLGTPDNALTGSLGWGYVGSDFSSKPVVMLGGETRVSSSIKLMTENIFVPGEAGAVLSGGLRILGESLSADLGLGGVAGDGGRCCLPLVNVVYHFGRR
jgi:hypothetical protein